MQDLIEKAKRQGDFDKALTYEHDIAEQKERMDQIRRELMRRQAVREAAERAAREAAERAGEGILKKLVKKGAGFIGRKVPFVAGGFFAADWYSGGLGHAVNELTWPASEIWRDDGMFGGSSSGGSSPP